VSPIAKPTSGLLALQAATADTRELRTILRSAALLVIFDREQTRAGGFKLTVGHDFFFGVLAVCRSYAPRHAVNDPGFRVAQIWSILTRVHEAPIVFCFFGFYRQKWARK